VKEAAVPRKKLGDAKIVNMHRGLRFEVTKKDIENGQPNDPCNCAAALALKRTIPGSQPFVYRDVTYILKVKQHEAFRYHTSSPLRLETVVFDRKGNFIPGEYDLLAAHDPAPPRPQAARKKERRRRFRGSKGGYRKIPEVRPTASSVSKFLTREANA